MDFFTSIKVPKDRIISKKTASDEDHRPCLPLKPQEKVYFSC